MIRILKPGGLCILTCASGERATHGTIDSDEGSSPFTPNYYKIPNAEDIAEKIWLGLYFNHHAFEINTIGMTFIFGESVHPHQLLKATKYVLGCTVPRPTRTSCSQAFKINPRIHPSQSGSGKGLKASRKTYKSY